jgi:hypothetical protein
MRSLLYYLLIAVIGWKAYQHFTNQAATEPAPSQDSATTLNDVFEVGTIQPLANQPIPTQQQSANNFACDGRTHCSHMRSFAEAKFFLQNCPNTEMDGDNDGIPCERQFGY